MKVNTDFAKELIKKQYGLQYVAVVAHGNVIRTVLHVLCGYSLTELQDIPIENASVTCISVSQEEGELRAKLST